METAHGQKHARRLHILVQKDGRKERQDYILFNVTYIIMSHAMHREALSVAIGNRILYKPNANHVRLVAYHKVYKTH